MIQDRLLGLLHDHDGDDRCGCLREIIADLAEHGNGPDQLEAAARLLGTCLATHPAGITFRSQPWNLP